MLVNIRPNLKPLQRAFVDFRAKQVPFASALALNELAAGVRNNEKKDILDTFDTPTRFTQNAYGIATASKAKPIASVFAKDVQSNYLAPYVNGGLRSLGSKKVMLVPRDVGLNQFGNIPRGRLQALKGRPDVFIGSVRFKKSGKTIAGVWQRPPASPDQGKGIKGKARKTGSVEAGLKLLIQFEASTPVPRHLDFYARAERYIRANASAAFDVAMTKALATARI